MTDMTTRDIVETYFHRLKTKGSWQELLAEDLHFTRLTSPVRELSGRDAYLAGTGPFFAMIKSIEVRSLVVEGDHAAALTRYELQPPAGQAFRSDVSELFRVRGGRIQDLEICFDMTPYPRAP
jgi:ketosteroid isomerase-like protein